MYKVIKYFTDLQDNDYPYNVGDVFPRSGLSVTEARLAELAGYNNKQHTPLIKAVSEAPKKPESEAPKKLASEAPKKLASEAPKKPAAKRKKTAES